MERQACQVLSLQGSFPLEAPAYLSQINYKKFAFPQNMFSSSGPKTNL
jgi:hypothetical protein